MFLSSRKRSYFLYIQNLNAPARARVRDPSARFMSHKSPGKQGVDVAGAAQRVANQDTQHHHVAAIKDCISHITSFCSGGKHLVLHENQTACFIESGATAMLWYFMVCLHVFPCGKTRLGVSQYIHLLCIKCAGYLPSTSLFWNFARPKKRHLHGGQHLGGCDGDLSSLLRDPRESSVGEPLEPTRTMAKTSPDSRFGILQKPFPTSARNLGTSGPPPKTGTFQNSPYTESEPPGTCPELSRPKALDSLRHHLPSPCDILVLGGKH